MTGSVVGMIVLALVGVLAIGFVALPFLAHEDAGASATARRQAQAAELAEAEEALGRSLAAIREIDADHRAGNLSDEDRRALDAAERVRAAALVRERDRLAAAAGVDGRAGAVPDESAPPHFEGS